MGANKSKQQAPPAYSPESKAEAPPAYEDVREPRPSEADALLAAASPVLDKVAAGLDQIAQVQEYVVDEARVKKGMKLIMSKLIESGEFKSAEYLRALQELDNDEDNVQARRVQAARDQIAQVQEYVVDEASVKNGMELVMSKLVESGEFKAAEYLRAVQAARDQIQAQRIRPRQLDKIAYEPELYTAAEYRERAKNGEFKAADYLKRAKESELPGHVIDDYFYNVSEDCRLCEKCDKTIWRKTSRTVKNPGRLFWAHRMGDVPNCNFFEWDIVDDRDTDHRVARL